MNINQHLSALRHLSRYDGEPVASVPSTRYWATPHSSCVSRGSSLRPVVGAYRTHLTANLTSVTAVAAVPLTAGCGGRRGVSPTASISPAPSAIELRLVEACASPWPSRSASKTSCQVARERRSGRASDIAILAQELQGVRSVTGELRIDVTQFALADAPTMARTAKTVA